MNSELDLTASRPGDRAASTASPLDPSDISIRPHAREILRKGSVGWLKNTEVRDLLVYHDDFRIHVAKDPPRQPAGRLSSTTSQPKAAIADRQVQRVKFASFAGGSLFLFNRKAVRFFRKDGHNWRKKADGKTVRETHEKLKAKILGLSMLACRRAKGCVKQGLYCRWGTWTLSIAITRMQTKKTANRYLAALQTLCESASAATLQASSLHPVNNKLQNAYGMLHLRHMSMHPHVSSLNLPWHDLSQLIASSLQSIRSRMERAMLPLEEPVAHCKTLMLHAQHTACCWLKLLCPQQLQRRAYWLLDGSHDEDLVLVHYLHVVKSAVNDSGEAATPARQMSRPATPSFVPATSTDHSSPPGSTSAGSDGQTYPHAQHPFHAQRQRHQQQQQQQQQQQSQGQAEGEQPMLHEASRASDGASASSATPMMLDPRQPAQSIPPDPYMPLLPSMSLDSFFMAVDDQHCPPLRPLRSHGSLDPFHNLEELAVGTPMDSLTLSGTDWRVSASLAVQLACIVVHTVPLLQSPPLIAPIDAC